MDTQIEEKLRILTDAWKEAKRMEQEWNNARINYESEIYALTERELPEKGTTTLATGMKIVTGFTEEWDQEALNEAHEEWPVQDVRFPFAGVWKPDTKAINVIRDNIPGLYALLRPALTLRPKKPSFSFPSNN